MRLMIILLCCCFFLTGCVKYKQAITKKEAVSFADDFFKALGSGDTLYLQHHLADDFVLYEHDQVWNIDSLLSLMPLTQGRVWEIQKPHFVNNGAIGHLYYYNQGVTPSDRAWLESMLMERQGSELKLRFMQSTKLYLK